MKRIARYFSALRILATFKYAQVIDTNALGSETTRQRKRLCHLWFPDSPERQIVLGLLRHCKPYAKFTGLTFHPWDKVTLIDIANQ